MLCVCRCIYIVIILKFTFCEVFSEYIFQQVFALIFESWEAKKSETFALSKAYLYVELK